MTRSAAVAAGRAEAILLDALGTLVGIVPPGGPLMRLLAERHGVRVDGEAVGRALRAEMAHYRAHCLGAGDPASLAVLRAECAEVIARELGAPVAAIDRAELTQTLLDALRFAAYPEVAEVLRRLRAGGARLIVVSNWDISLHEALAQARLSPLIDGVVSSAAVGAAKPSPAVRPIGPSTSATATKRTSPGPGRPGSPRSCSPAPRPGPGGSWRRAAPGA
jgi:putative hydrolase of the HAD superfamily